MKYVYNDFHVYLLHKDRLKWPVHVNTYIYDLNGKKHAQTLRKLSERVDCELSGGSFSLGPIVRKRKGLADQLKWLHVLTKYEISRFFQETIKRNFCDILK